MQSILLFHIFPVNHWKKVADTLLANLPFNKVVVHVSLHQDETTLKSEIAAYLNGKKVDQILWSANSGYGEVDALRKFVTEIDLSGYDWFTYMHCKGVTKPENENISAWTRMMHYFIIERTDLCKRAFRRGYWAYGVNKTYHLPNDDNFQGSTYHYSGNFVTINLKQIGDLKSKVLTHLSTSYYGVEALWGKFIPDKKAYTAFDSELNHYFHELEARHYDNWLGRTKYEIIQSAYSIRYKLHCLFALRKQRDDNQSYPTR